MPFSAIHQFVICTCCSRYHRVFCLIIVSFPCGQPPFFHYDGWRDFDNWIKPNDLVVAGGTKCGTNWSALVILYTPHFPNISPPRARASHHCIICTKDAVYVSSYPRKGRHREVPMGRRHACHALAYSGGTLRLVIYAYLLYMAIMCYYVCTKTMSLSVKYSVRPLIL